MERGFILVMDKLILTNRGFTLIETLFVLLVICLLMTISMTLHIPSKTENMRIDEIVLFLKEAQLYAMTSKEMVKVSFDYQIIRYESLSLQKEYHLDENTYFDAYSFTFNNEGHIKTAKTVWYHTPLQDYAFVYQIGSGYFYVQ